MNKKYLLSSVMAGIALLYANQSTAQCLTKQDCVALGYTKTSCPNGGIKCPFGNTWSCIQSCSTAYKYACSGTGYSGGIGSACGGKYTQCKCASSYVWKDGSCQKNGAHGDLYYCNGIVMGVKVSEMNFYVALIEHEQDLGAIEANSKGRDYVFCKTTRGSLLRGKLPSTSQLYTIYVKQSQINTLLSENGGEEISSYGTYWSSTPHDDGIRDYYLISMYDGSEPEYYGGIITRARSIIDSW